MSRTPSHFSESITTLATKQVCEHMVVGHAEVITAQGHRYRGKNVVRVQRQEYRYPNT